LIGQAMAAGKEAGRDMSNYRVMSAAPAFFGDMETCREATRWFDRAGKHRPAAGLNKLVQF
ncbi:MAG: hypothetical protein AAF633_28935, partial [Chloroflexota bacterium]